MTAGEALAAAASRLRAAGVPDPARDARMLLAHAARVDAARVTLIAPEDLEPDIEERFDTLISLRAIRVPVSQLIGERAFYGRKFNVSRDVLDPRPETETLVEAALAEPFATVLDLGTGSGCILVTLLAERPSAVGVGVDLSEPACLQASANAHLHDVAARAEILQSDWYADVKGQFDVIVANPPYLSRDEMLDVAPELLQHEPRMALTDDADGLQAYRRIIAEAPIFLQPGGRLLLEIGWQQADAVLELVAGAGFSDAHVIHDLDDRDRVIAARL